MVPLAMSSRTNDTNDSIMTPNFPGTTFGLRKAKYRAPMTMNIARKIRITVRLKSRGPIEKKTCLCSNSSMTLVGAQMISLAVSHSSLARIKTSTPTPFLPRGDRGCLERQQDQVAHHGGDAERDAIDLEHVRYHEHHDRDQYETQYEADQRGRMIEGKRDA